jgi:ABC-type antimicrobial peptide transport system permease subunit
LAIAFALVLGGVMFLTSLGMAWREDPGLRVRDAVLVRVGFGEPVPPARENEVAASLRSLPGVSAAGAFDVPMLENITRASAVFRDPEGGTPDEPRPALLRVGSGYFDAAAIQLLEGRYPTDAELESGAPVIVVSQALAKRYWPNGGAVGQTLRAGREDSTVVGVVRDIRAVALDVAPTGTIFAPLSLARSLTITANVFLALDGRGDVTADDVRSHLAPIDAAVRVTHVQRVEDALSESIRTRRISAFAASSFAIGAIALVAIGLFGLVAQTAGWRTREMGIRVALGGTPAGIVRLVVGEQVGAVLGGLVAGGLLAAAAARFVGAYLYGVTPYDVRTWSVALVVVLATAALGALVPAARASRTDPIVALRTD